MQDFWSSGALKCLARSPKPSSTWSPGKMLFLANGDLEYSPEGAIYQILETLEPYNF